MQRLLASVLSTIVVLHSYAIAEPFEESFGQTDDGQPVTRYTITNPSGMKLCLLDYGATIQSIVAVDRNGEFADVVFGFDDMAGYQSDANGYFGCTVGRYANRIASGRFELGGEAHQLATNDGPNHLHGGEEGRFDRVIWNAKPFSSDQGDGVVFSYVSPDGSAGYPGKLKTTVRFTLTPDNRVSIVYEATTDAPTIVNLTNHAYFNLAGAGTPTINDHLLTIDANGYTPVDDTLIPTGEIVPVDATPFDFRDATAIGLRVDQLGEGRGAGYDHNFVLRRATGEDGVRRAARLSDPKSGRTLEVWTDQPGVQFYGGNFLDGCRGKAGETYEYRSGLCLETQLFPNSPNEPEWPSPVLGPGETYRHTCVYAFGVEE